MNKVVEILVKRDKNTELEAIGRIKEVRQMMKECNYDPEECESLVMDYLGLEMDYIDEILYG